MGERTKPTPGTTPEGDGIGRPFVPTPMTFLGMGCFVRSIVDPLTPRGLVSVEITGRWNHEQKMQTITVIMHPDVADGLGPYISQAANSAREDERDYRAAHPTLA